MGIVTLGLGFWDWDWDPSFMYDALLSQITVAVFTLNALTSPENHDASNSKNDLIIPNTWSGAPCRDEDAHEGRVAYFFISSFSKEKQNPNYSCVLNTGRSIL